VLGTAAVLGAFAMDHTYGLLLAGYLLNNLLYSFLLKHTVILDVGSIALGFVLRVLAGAAVIDVEASPWLIMCTILLASFLGFAKRRHELKLLLGADGDHRRVLNDYSEALLDQLILISGASTVMSYALYTVSDKALTSFGTTDLIYTVPFVLYGLFRYLYLIHMRDSGGDPSRVLLTDAPLITSVVLWLATCCAIVYGR
jgi:4-hydroxybenzoate polyprenyltransferase